MGTTAEKLAYLKETKNQIKQALETPSNVMRDYPALIKKYIDNQPTQLVTDGICKNALDVPIVRVGIDGNSYQGEEPSPDNPKDIEVIDGVNLIDLKTLLDYWECTYTYDESTNTYTVTSVGYGYSRPYELFSEDKVCSFSGIVKNITSIKARFEFLNSNNQSKAGVYENIPNVENVSVSKVRLNYTSNGTFELKDIMCNLGTTPKPYLPHGHIGLKHKGINQFPYDNIDYTNNYFNMKINNSKITLNGYSNPTSYSFTNPVVNNTNYVATLTNVPLFYLKPGTYTLSIQNAKNMVDNTYVLLRKMVNQNTGNVLCTIQLTNITSETFVIAENEGIFIGIQLNSAVTFENASFDIMLNRGSTKENFEPYHSPKVYPINLNGNSISKVGDVKDLLKIYRNGDVEIEKKIGKVAPDGSENIVKSMYSNETYSVFCFNEYNNLLLDDKPLISNYFINDNNIGTSSSITKEAIGYKSSNYGIRISTLKSNSDTVEQFKTWLAQNKLVIDYQLDTPETIKLPSIEPIELWQGTNKFELITNLDTTFEVEYVVDKKHILGEIQTAILNAEKES